MASAAHDDDAAPAQLVLKEEAAARYINFSVPFLRLTRRENRGPAFVRIGRTVRYRIADLDAWLAGHRVTTRESR